MSDEIKRKILALVFGIVGGTELAIYVYLRLTRPVPVTPRDAGIVVVTLAILGAAVYTWRFKPPVN